MFFCHVLSLVPLLLSAIKIRFIPGHENTKIRFLSEPKT
ncbi:Uncharacterized protein dnm_035900 [Desulfonema magnum]|uniref:Uncharacterized protein n=1 Tax=Desulfonema magnum TaxID=45655 RepID=A0A975BL83_9BACT|nr:Uncharacterized protein dnm_035900 [Desulfonema magnum]